MSGAAKPAVGASIYIKIDVSLSPPIVALINVTEESAMTKPAMLHNIWAALGGHADDCNRFIR